MTCVCLLVKSISPPRLVLPVHIVLYQAAVGRILHITFMSGRTELSLAERRVGTLADVLFLDLMSLGPFDRSAPFSFCACT